MITPYDVTTGIIANRPGEPFVYDGDATSLAGLEWQADTKPPTWAQAQAWAQAIADARASSDANAATIATRIGDAIATLEQAVGSWANLTAAQKDATTKLAVRVVAALGRLVLRRFDSGGV